MIAGCNCQIHLQMCSKICAQKQHSTRKGTSYLSLKQCSLNDCIFDTNLPHNNQLSLRTNIFFSKALCIFQFACGYMYHGHKMMFLCVLSALLVSLHFKFLHQFRHDVLSLRVLRCELRQTTPRWLLRRNWLCSSPSGSKILTQSRVISSRGVNHVRRLCPWFHNPCVSLPLRNILLARCFGRKLWLLFLWRDDGCSRGKIYVVIVWSAHRGVVADVAVVSLVFRRSWRQRFGLLRGK